MLLQIPSFFISHFRPNSSGGHIAEIRSNAVARRTALARAHTATEPGEKMMRPGIILLREGTDTSQVSPSGLDESGWWRWGWGGGVMVVVVLRCLLVPSGYSPHLFVLLPPARISSCARSTTDRARPSWSATSTRARRWPTPSGRPSAPGGWTSSSSTGGG